NQDKATPSMMGNVHQGVMLNQKPIFLGGQGGIVGPLRMGYGCITAAGSIIRKNELANDRLILGGGFKEISLPRRVGVYSHVDVILNNNMTYIAGLISLNAWYRFVRPLFVHDFFSEELLLGMQRNLANCIGERRKQLKILNEKLLISKEILLTDTKGKETSAICLHKAAIEKLKKADAIFGKEMDSDLMTREGEIFIKAVETEVGKKRQKYISVIQNLDPQVAMTGSQWLYDIEKKICTPLLITAAKEKSGN
ncbi:MAG: protein GlmU, partial [Proteobacteria bacterium]|nr:protein GlmU [Pseudomonadota bacterium]